MAAFFRGATAGEGDGLLHQSGLGGGRAVLRTSTIADEREMYIRTWRFKGAQITSL